MLGFFALTVITPDFIQTAVLGRERVQPAAAGIGVGILTVPLVASVSEDAMRAVPMNLREASFGLGARRRSRPRCEIVFPAAISGIVAALILATSRAIGETMVVAVAAGAPQGRTVNPLDPGGTMTSAMVQLATGSDQVTGNSAAFQSLFFIGLLLFIITLVLNVDRRRVRPPRAAALLGSRHDDHRVLGKATGAAVREGLAGRKRDVSGTVFLDPAARQPAVLARRSCSSCWPT